MRLSACSERRIWCDTVLWRRSNFWVVVVVVGGSSPRSPPGHWDCWDVVLLCTVVSGLSRWRTGRWLLPLMSLSALRAAACGGVLLDLSACVSADRQLWRPVCSGTLHGCPPSFRSSARGAALAPREDQIALCTFFMQQTITDKVITTRY